MTATPMTARPGQSATKRERIARDQGMRCFYCSRMMAFHAKRQANSVTLDHLVPRCDGGTRERENVVAACYRCNHAKGRQSVQQFLASPKFAAIVSITSKRAARKAARQAAIGDGGRWLPNDRAGFRASDMGLDSPPMIGLAAAMKPTPSSAPSTRRDAWWSGRRTLLPPQTPRLFHPLPDSGYLRL